MRVVFGWHLDGPTFPETVDGAEFSLGSDVVGPMGLVGLIEARLGLDGPSISSAMRIAQYWSRLRAIDDETRFCSASLDADGWATARLLLGWRDSLIAGGWNPTASSWTSDRLSLLSEVEMLEETPMDPGLSDRLRLILRRLKSPSPIDALTLVDPVDLLPPVWTELIERLKAAGATVTAVSICGQTTGNDLARLQERLLTGASADLSGDDSFVVVRCDDEWSAAEIAAGWLQADVNANGRLAIIRQGDSTLLNEACHRVGLPRPGGSERSRWRSAVQVLPLAFETVWSPLDAGRLLELLVVPGSPIRPSVGQLFADALRNAPGVGGPEWQRSWSAARDRYREVLGDEERQEGEIDAALAEEEATWKAWLEPDRFDRDAGLTKMQADVICRRVQNWALRRAAGTENSVYLYAAEAAMSLADVLENSGLEQISKSQIDRMIDAVLADGISLPGYVAEAAPWTPVDGPGQIWGPVDSVLWWGFMDPGVTAPSSPWSRAEREELEEVGCQLQSREAPLALERNSWHRAILNAQERVVCVVPNTVSGEPAEPHPLWHEIRDMVERCGHAVDGRTVLGSPQFSFGSRVGGQVEVEQVALPVPRRTWHVNAETIGARERESATSIENLLGCPFRWAVQYQAGIKEGALLDIADDNRLKGILAHAVIADLFTGPELSDENEVRVRAESLLDAYLPKIAAPFLMPGRIRDREDVCRHTVNAAVELFKLIRDMGLSVVGAEQRHEGALDEHTRLIGFIDLLLRTGDDLPVVIDLKWSNWDRYRREEIAEGRAVQLATYSRLVHDGKSGTTPPAGYFMLKQQRLLSIATAPFPENAHVSGSDLDEVWRAIVESRATALELLRRGEVTAAGVAVEEVAGEAVGADPTALSIEPPCRFCAYGRLCGQKVLR